MYLYDTNIFLEVLLKQEKVGAAYEALERMSEDRRGVITHFSVHAIEALLGAKLLWGALAGFLRFLGEHPYLDVYSTTATEEAEIVGLAPGLHLDFDDALQFYVARKLGLVLVTFDRDFEKTKGVEILFPNILSGMHS